jgi:hypothetical protein
VIYLISRSARVLAFSASSALALVGVVGGGADANVSSSTHAATAATTVITGGVGTIPMEKAYIANMTANNIIISPITPLLVNSNPNETYTTTSWTTNGGDADLNSCTGFVHLAGGSIVTNIATGQSLVLTDIRFDVANDSIDYTIQTQAGPQPIVSMLLGGTQSGWVHGGVETYSASEVFINPATASVLDGALGTNAFADTNVFGSFSTTFTVSPSTAASAASRHALTCS